MSIRVAATIAALCLAFVCGLGTVRADKRYHSKRQAALHGAAVMLTQYQQQIWGPQARRVTAKELTLVRVKGDEALVSKRLSPWDYGFAHVTVQLKKVGRGKHDAWQPAKPKDLSKSIRYDW